MALNEIFKIGKSISLPVPAGTASGDPVRVGVLNGVAVVDEGTGGNAEGFTSVDLFGGHLFRGLDGAAVGDVVYIDSNGDLSLTGDDVYGAVTHLHDREPGAVVVLIKSIDA